MDQASGASVPGPRFARGPLGREEAWPKTSKGNEKPGYSVCAGQADP